MKILWKGHGQHTKDAGVFKPGDIIDLEERGIPAATAAPWIRTGDAEVVIEEAPEPVPAPRPKPEKPKKPKKTAGRNAAE